MGVWEGGRGRWNKNFVGRGSLLGGGCSLGGEGMSKFSVGYNFIT